MPSSRNRIVISRETHDTSDSCDLSDLRAIIDSELGILSGGSARLEEVITRAFTFYTAADYERALERINVVVREREIAEPYLRSYIEICHRVTDLGIHKDDLPIQKRVANYDMQALRNHGLVTKLLGKPRDMRRCKYCARYIDYIHPNAYKNSCRHCHRSFPMPSWVWDSVWGQAYSYYRSSVNEDEFYREFESRYEFRSFNDKKRL